MDSKTYWDIFTKSGKIEDYLTFCKGRMDYSATQVKDFTSYATEYQRSDTQRTEYR